MKVYLGSAGNLRAIIPTLKRALLNFWIDNNPTFEFYKGADVICDSGAFSFMANPKKLKGMDIDEYCDRYCECVNKYRIAHFLEMDVDTLIGTEKALQLRKRIEAKAFHVPIPVWHCERGKKGWEEMCDNYDYVALPMSGKNKTSRWFREDDYKRLWWFVDEAHKRGARIHALGLGGNSSLYRKGAFYSCDSVAWTFSIQAGVIQTFSPKERRWVKRARRDGYRHDFIKMAFQSVLQWRLFSDWAETNL